jgi:hypothetical protein
MRWASGHAGRSAARVAGLASGLALAVRPGQCAAFRLVAVTFRPALGALAISGRHGLGAAAPGPAAVHPRYPSGLNRQPGVSGRPDPAVRLLTGCAR